MQPQFMLQLLGQFQLTYGNQPITGLAEKAQALLAYLAAEPATHHSREQVAELFWPERPNGVARQNLRQMLSRLQKSLPNTNEPLLQITRQEVSFNPAVTIQIDLVTVTSALAQVHDHDHSAITTCPPCCALLTTAVTHYQGQFLAAFFGDSPAFDEWVLLKRATLHNELVRALGTLIEHHIAQGQWREAIHYAQRSLELDPLLEESHQQLMRSLAQSGRRSEALAQYERLCTLLRAELNLAPTAASTALYDTIRGGQFGSAPTLATVTASPTIPHNLPPQQTPFVGRKQLLQQITERLAQPECHLLTLVGPGGVGKTRLALETATQLQAIATARYPDGIYFVPLATAEGDGQLLTTLATVIDYRFPDAAENDTTRLAALCTTLREKRLLLLLDNVEQLAAETAVPTAILDRAPGVQLLVTSRVPLDLRAEWLIDIGGLAYSEREQNKEHASRSLATLESIQFFHSAARRVLADFTLAPQLLSIVGELCTVTEGMPLALELAASQVRTQPLPLLLAGVQENLDLLATTMRDVPPRHRSLRAVFMHSWQLLPPSLQQIFRQLALFRGTFSAEAAGSIPGCTARALTDLCTHSLLRAVEQDTTPRYAMHEVLRQYAAEQLAQQPAEERNAAHHHAHYYLTLVTNAESALASSRARQAMTAMRVEFANIESGWQWAVNNGEFALVAPSVHALLRFAVLTSQTTEIGQLFDLALRALTVCVHEQTDVRWETQALLAELHALRARLFFKQARYAAGEDHAQQALALATQIEAPQAATRANFYWGLCLMSQGDYGAATDKLHAALAVAQVHQWPYLECDILRALGIIADQQGNLEEARHYYEASLALSQGTDNPRGNSATLGNLGDICRRQGDFEAAAHALAESLAVHQSIGDRSSEGRTLTHLGELQIDLEEYTAAERSFGEALHILRGLEEEHYAADALVGLGKVYRIQGRRDLAIVCWEEAETIYTAVNEAPQLAEVQGYLREVGRIRHNSPLL